MKRRISLVLAFVMLFAMAAPSLAEEASPILESASGFYYIEAEGERPRLSAASQDKFMQVDGEWFKDLNGNGALDVYEDWRASDNDRAADLVSKMTLDEKVGSLFHNFTGGTFSPLYPATDEWIYSQEPRIEIDGTKYVPLWYDINENHVTDYAYSSAGTPREQMEVLNKLQEIAEDTRLGIPLSFSTDRPYNTWGSMINMPYYAFGVAHDPELLYDMVAQYSKEMRAMGYTTIFHSYGVEIGSWYGDEVNYIREMITAETKAYEENGVHAMTKHYIARGGRSSFGNARSDAQLWENWMVGWRAAVQDGKTSTIMMNNSTGLTNTPILYDSETIGYLRNELGFDGVLCTDWPLFVGPPNVTGYTNDGQDLSQMTVGELYTRMLECGIDQFGSFIILDGTDTDIEGTNRVADLFNWPDALIECVENGTCSEGLIDRSAFRIMRAKFDLDMFEDPFRDYAEALAIFASDAYIAEEFEITSVEDIVRARNDALNEMDEQLQTKSTVLLKNDNNILPLSEGCKVYVESNVSDITERDAEAIGAYATVVGDMTEADVVVAHVTALNDAYQVIMDDAISYEKPVVLIVEATNTSNEPGAFEVEHCDAILMQTYQNTPDHGSAIGDFYRYVFPSITADMLFGTRTPGGSLVFEIARNEEDALYDWGDLQLDTGIDDAARLYLAATIRNDPDFLVPNNLGDVLYTTNFGLTYGEQPDFDFNTLVVPKAIQETEEEVYGSMQTVKRVVEKVQTAGEPFEISFIAQNNGADGYFYADVYDGDELIASKFMALDAGQFRIVTIELTLDAGVHEISVCGLTKTITVE